MWGIFVLMWGIIKRIRHATDIFFLTKTRKLRNFQEVLDFSQWASGEMLV